MVDEFKVNGYTTVFVFFPAIFSLVDKFCVMLSAIFAKGDDFSALVLDSL